LIQYFGCFSVADGAVAATIDDTELQCRCSVGKSTIRSTTTQMQRLLELCSGWWAVWPDINNVIGDDTETGCYYRVCSSTRTHSLLRGSVGFCSIRCVLALKFCGEARMHEIYKTQKSFLEILPRNDLIRSLTGFELFC